jgi:Uma2 family endonuclease
MDAVTTLPHANGLTIADLEAMPGYGVKYELIDGSIYVSGRHDKLTRGDLDAMPEDDGRRYELIDGVIVVSAAPSNRHQGIVTRLVVLLSAAVPPQMRVRTAPFDVMLSDHTVVEPDVLVARAADLDDRGLRGAPLLAIEVLSRTSRHRDLTIKRDLYAAAGCPSYWVIEPGDADTDPSLTAWELADGEYAEVARVTGGESWTSDKPFALTIVPDDLLDD